MGWICTFRTAWQKRHRLHAVPSEPPGHTSSGARVGPGSASSLQSPVGRRARTGEDPHPDPVPHPEERTSLLRAC